MEMDSLPDSTYSMTPPSSEGEMELDMELDVADVPVVRFSCLGEVHPAYFQIDKESYLMRGTLIRLLQNKNGFDSRLFPANKLSNLFGFNFIPNCLEPEIHKLFYMARQKYSMLENCGLDLSTGVTQGKEDCRLMREEIVRFLYFLGVYITSLPREEGNPQHFLIVKKLKCLLFHMGRLSALPSHTITTCNRGNSSTSASYHLYHLHLDVAWLTANIFYILQTNGLTPLHIKLSNRTMTGDSVEDNLFSEYLHLVLWDLTLLAVQMFQKVSLHEYKSMSPFSCTCVRELWLLIIFLLDTSSKESKNVNSFWVMMQIITHSILNPKIPESQENKAESCSIFEYEPRIECDNREGFCWWLLTHLVPLYQEKDPNCIPAHEEHLKSNYSLLQNLISETIQSQRTDEVRMRCYLQCCVLVCEFWGSSIGEILMPLWPYFFKHLNSTFGFSYAVDGLPSLETSGSKWLKRIKNPRNDKATVNSETSYQLFLKLIQLHLTPSVSDQDRKLFKGRVYMKFHHRKMQELSGFGLKNFFSLFLTLAVIADFSEVTKRMCELLDMIPLQSITNNQLTVMWHGMFAIMCHAEDLQESAPEVAHRLACGFSHVCHEINQGNLKDKTGGRNEQMKLVVLYVKNLQEVVERSRLLNLSEHILIAPGFDAVLNKSSNDEIHLILLAIQSIITNQRIICKRHGQQDGVDSKKFNLFSEHKALATALWNHVLPFVKQHVKTLTPPPILADIAAGLSLMANDIPFDLSTVVTLTSLFVHFGLSVDVNPEICSRYLCHLLNQQNVVETLHKQVKDFEALVIAAWFRCTILLPQTGTSKNWQEELTRLVFKLPQMETLFSETELGIDFDSEPEEEVVKFLKALSLKFSSIQNFPEKVAFRRQVQLYFNGLEKATVSILRANSPPDVLRRIYLVLGELVQTCAPLIYTVSKADCLLVFIMNEMIVQRNLRVDKPVPPVLQTALKESLYLYVNGLLTLNPRTDKYISRSLREIFEYYTLTFYPKSATNQGAYYLLHPIIVTILSSEQSETSKQILPFYLDMIRSTFLDRPQQFPGQQLNTVMYVVCGLLEEGSVEIRVTISQTLLMSSMNVLLLTDDVLLKRTTTKAVQLMLETCKSCEAIIPRTSWTPKMQDFIVQHITARGSHLFKLLEILARSYSSLVKEMIPTITQCIHDAEEKRGVGHDRSLRQGQCRLLQALGISVQQSVLDSK